MVTLYFSLKTTKSKENKHRKEIVRDKESTEGKLSSSPHQQVLLRFLIRRKKTESRSLDLETSHVKLSNISLLTFQSTRVMYFSSLILDLIP